MCSLFGDTAKHLDSKSTAKCAVGCAGPACNRIPVLPTTTLSTAVKSNRPSQQVVEEEQGEGEGEGCDVCGGEGASFVGLEFSKRANSRMRCG